MMQSHTAPLTGLTALAAAAVLLSGCASPQPASNGTGGGEAVSELALSATWLGGSRVIGLVTQGSSTCVPNPTEIAHENGKLIVTLEDPDSDVPCARDFVSRLTTISAPAGTDSTQPLKVLVAYGDSEGVTRLEGNEAVGGSADEGQPAAVWVSPNEIALLTWGSSSRACYPKPESTTVDASVIRVRMAAPADERICTTDFSPQGTIVFVDGATDNEKYELALSGQGFDAETLVAVGNTP